MAGIIIGALLIVFGALITFVVRPRLLIKGAEIERVETTPIAELKEKIKHYEAQGNTEYREYAELKGVATSDTPIKTPYTENEVAYYEAEIYQVHEAMEYYTNQNGRQGQRVRRKEDLMSRQVSGPIVIKDEATGEKAYIELTSDVQLDTIKSFNKFEPINMMNRYGFFAGFHFNPMGLRTLGFRMVERTIPLNHPLYVLGEAYLSGDRLMVQMPSNKKPFIVSVKSESELIRSSKTGAAVALVSGIVMGFLGIAAILFLK